MSHGTDQIALEPARLEDADAIRALLAAHGLPVDDVDLPSNSRAHAQRRRS